jgi:hypothetical protein
MKYQLDGTVQDRQNQRLLKHKQGYIKNSTSKSHRGKLLSIRSIEDTDTLHDLIASNNRLLVCRRRSNSLDKSLKMATVYLFSSSDLFQSSMTFRSAVLYISLFMF